MLMEFLTECSTSLKKKILEEMHTILHEENAVCKLNE